MFFIFDWDGTLSDSAEKIIGCMQRAAVDVDISPKDDEAIKNIIGLGLPEAIAHLYPGLSPKLSLDLKDAYSHQFVNSDVEPSPLFPGVMEGLEVLRERGHTLAVATGKSRKGLNRVLESFGLSSFFHGSRCADETASKPHPLMLSELLTEFSRHPEDAVMVGDTEYDMAMAAEIGMPRIAVSYGAHHIDRLKVFSPDLCIDEFDQILAWGEE